MEIPRAQLRPFRHIPSPPGSIPAPRRPISRCDSECSSLYGPDGRGTLWEEEFEDDGRSLRSMDSGRPPSVSSVSSASSALTHTTSRVVAATLSPVRALLHLKRALSNHLPPASSSDGLDHSSRSNPTSRSASPVPLREGGVFLGRRGSDEALGARAIKMSSTRACDGCSQVDIGGLLLCCHWVCSPCFTITHRRCPICRR